MRVHDSLLELIGQTPLVRLRRVSAGLRPPMIAKLEFLNPGASVKDRPALWMVEAAERSGELRPGATIIEPTSGNTGVGLALVAQERGYRCVFTCPDKVAHEKRNVLRALGAEVVVCPASASPDSPDFYRNVARRLASELDRAVVLDQYSNPNNALAHYQTTGPELWEQTQGRITHLVVGVGTGGTISGAGAYLKEVSAGTVEVIGADPDGSVYSGGTGRPYLVEGVGQPRVPVAFDPDVPDRILAVSDRDSIEMTRRLAREEGLLVGGSGGMAVAAALRVAAELDESAVVVVILPDSGRGYLSKLFDDDWLVRYGFAGSAPGLPRVVDVLDGGGSQPLVWVTPRETLAGAVAVMREHGVAYLPVFDAEPPIRAAEVAGTLAEETLADALARGRASVNDSVASLMSPPLPFVGAAQDLSEATAVVADAGAALVLDAGIVRGVLTAQRVVDGLLAERERVALGTTGAAA